MRCHSLAMLCGRCIAENTWDFPLLEAMTMPVDIRNEMMMQWSWRWTVINDNFVQRWLLFQCFYKVIRGPSWLWEVFIVRNGLEIGDDEDMARSMMVLQNRLNFLSCIDFPCAHCVLRKCLLSLGLPRSQTKEVLKLKSVR